MPHLCLSRFDGTLHIPHAGIAPFEDAVRLGKDRNVSQRKVRVKWALVVTFKQQHGSSVFFQTLSPVLQRVAVPLSRNNTHLK